MMTFDSKLEEQHFQFWEYRVSHGQLLIRSPKSSRQTNNIDLVFKGVKYVCLPRYLKGIKMLNVTDEDRNQIEKVLAQQVEREHIRVLGSGGQKYYVVSEVFYIQENDREIFDSGLG